MKNLVIQTIQNDLGFNLYAMLFVCYIVITLDNLMKYKRGVLIVVCHCLTLRLSLIEFIFINYQTSELQCNY